MKNLTLNEMAEQAKRNEKREDAVIKIIKELRENFHVSVIAKRPFTSEEYCNKENDYIDEVHKWAKKAEEAEVFRFFSNFLEEMEEDELIEEMEEISLYHFKKLVIECTTQGSDKMCRTGYCDVGTCMNCVHYAGVRCFEKEISDFNPNNCKDCPISKFNCGFCDATRDTFYTEYDDKDEEAEDND